MCILADIQFLRSQLQEARNPFIPDVSNVTTRQIMNESLYADLYTQEPLGNKE